jgi:hypothetical protein
MRDPSQEAVAFSRDEAVIAGPGSSAFRGHGSVYVVGGNKLQFLARAGASGNLFPAQTFEDGVGSVNGLLDASSVAVAPAGFAVFATGRGDAAVAAFHRSKIPGDLDFWEAMFDGAGGVSGLTGAESVAVSPDSRFLYVAGFLDDAVAVFSIKPIIFSDRFTYGTGWELDETWSGAYGDGLEVVSTEYYSPYYALQVTATSTCAAGTYDVYLSSQTIYDSRSYESCASITAGDNFVIANGGSATFAAADVIVLRSGFAVDPGGLFTAAIDPSLSHLSYVRDDSPDSEPTYNVEFFVDADNLTMGADDEIQHFAAYDQDGTRLFRLWIVAGPAVILEVRDATEMSYQTTGVALSPGWNKIAITWEASSSATASLSVNDGAPEELMGLDTETHRIDSVRWGVLGGTLDSTSGTIVLDDFTSWR